MATHTPGPWTIVGATHIWHTGPNGAAVCIVAEPEVNTSADFREVEPTSNSWDVAMSNAALIAAAPELLETLTAIVACSPYVPLPGHVWEQASVLLARLNNS